MTPPPITEQSGAAVIARFLKQRGVRRVYGLCGGHIMPIWMRLDAEGIRIIDVRDERAAVYMAHAEAQLSGSLGVALVTAGPGVTNAMTGIANAHVARAPVLVLSGLPPTAQENRGALQDIVHTDLVRGITRYARTVRHPALIPQELAEATARAQGEGGEAGPVYLTFRSIPCAQKFRVPCSYPSCSTVAYRSHHPRILHRCSPRSTCCGRRVGPCSSRVAAHKVAGLSWLLC
ncbi:MAG: Acetolactate synthase large subunit IlvG [Pseudomonadota bacterium]